MNQYQACLDSFECISHKDSKYSTQIPKCWHFLQHLLHFDLVVCSRPLHCKCLTPIGLVFSEDTCLRSYWCSLSSGHIRCEWKVINIVCVNVWSHHFVKASLFKPYTFSYICSSKRRNLYFQTVWTSDWKSFPMVYDRWSSRTRWRRFTSDGSQNSLEMEVSSLEFSNYDNCTVMFPCIPDEITH